MSDQRPKNPDYSLESSKKALRDIFCPFFGAVFLRIRHLSIDSVTNRQPTHDFRVLHEESTGETMTGKFVRSWNTLMYPRLSLAQILLFGRVWILHRYLLLI